MAYFIFVDESCQDRRNSPYEVLAGIAIKDSALWDMVQDLHAAELRAFGRRYSSGPSELKGTKLLKAKVCHHARLNVDVKSEQVQRLAKQALDNGACASVANFKALALAKIAYVQEVFGICAKYECKAFASIVETDTVASETDGLRKDYAYLFERFSYYLEDIAQRDYRQHQGIVVFDELDKTQSHLLINQTHKYFKDTATGRQRSALIVPEPFFVHSDLTTGVQIADLIAYTVSWGFRLPAMIKPARPELNEFSRQVAKLRYHTVRNRAGRSDFSIWSFAHIRDLRTRMERDGPE